MAWLISAHYLPFIINIIYTTPFLFLQISTSLFLERFRATTSVITMGNCVSSKFFCGKSSRISDEEALEMMKRSLMAYEGTSRSSGAAATTKVKIKITKRELEILLGNYKVVEVTEELPTAQFLSRLIDVDDALEMQPRSWRPSLQSIPETDWSLERDFIFFVFFFFLLLLLWFMNILGISIFCLWFNIWSFFFFISKLFLLYIYRTKLLVKFHFFWIINFE